MSLCSVAVVVTFWPVVAETITFWVDMMRIFLYGGADVFAMSKGIDQVWDFNPSENDMISALAIDGIN